MKSNLLLVSLGIALCQSSVAATEFVDYDAFPTNSRTNVELPDEHRKINLPSKPKTADDVSDVQTTDKLKVIPSQIDSQSRETEKPIATQEPQSEKQSSAQSVRNKARRRTSVMSEDPSSDELDADYTDEEVGIADKEAKLKSIDLPASSVSDASQVNHNTNVSEKAEMIEIPVPKQEPNVKQVETKPKAELSDYRFVGIYLGMVGFLTIVGACLSLWIRRVGERFGKVVRVEQKPIGIAIKIDTNKNTTEQSVPIDTTSVTITNVAARSNRSSSDSK